MPVNAPVEYYKAEEAYKSARTREEKIKYLEEMIRLLPKHKGTHNVLAQLRRRLAKLKEQKEAATGRKQAFSIKKEGVGQVCLIGLANSGKSSLLKQLTGVDVEIADFPYTTTRPEMGMMQYEDVWVQIIEIPSTFEPQWMGIAHSADLIIRVIDGDGDLDEQRKELNEIFRKFKIKTKTIKVITKRPINLTKLKSEIWNNFNVIRVYTKAQGKLPEKKPIVMKKDSTVKDAVKEIHKEFLKHFRFARIWGKSVKFNGATVGLEHVLEDKDVIQIFAR